MFGGGFEATYAGIKAEPSLRLDDILVEVLVLESVVLKGRDCLFDDAQPHNRAWNLFRAPMPALQVREHGNTSEITDWAVK